MELANLPPTLIPCNPLYVWSGRKRRSGMKRAHWRTTMRWAHGIPEPKKPSPDSCSYRRCRSTAAYNTTARSYADSLSSGSNLVRESAGASPPTVPDCIVCVPCSLSGVYHHLGPPFGPRGVRHASKSPLLPRTQPSPARKGEHKLIIFVQLLAPAGRVVEIELVGTLNVRH